MITGKNGNKKQKKGKTYEGAERVWFYLLCVNVNDLDEACSQYLNETHELNTKTNALRLCLVVTPSHLINDLKCSSIHYFPISKLMTLYANHIRDWKELYSQRD